MMKKDGRGKWDREKLGEVFLCLILYTMCNENTERQVFKPSTRKSPCKCLGGPSGCSPGRGRISRLKLCFRERRQPVLSKGAWLGLLPSLRCGSWGMAGWQRWASAGPWPVRHSATCMTHLQWVFLNLWCTLLTVFLTRYSISMKCYS